MDVLAALAAERLSLADFLETISPEQWETPSLCADWDVRKVVGHLITPFIHSNLVVTAASLRGGRIGGKGQLLERDVLDRSTDDMIEILRANADTVIDTRLGGIPQLLTEVVVHGEDIRRPLYAMGSPPVTSLLAILEFMVSWKARPTLVGHGRLRDLRFHACDLGWIHGDGLLVAGSALDLIVAMSGRPEALRGLHGDGVSLIRHRMFTA